MHAEGVAGVITTQLTPSAKSQVAFFGRRRRGAGAGADAGAPPQNGPGVLCAARLLGIWLAMALLSP